MNQAGLRHVPHPGKRSDDWLVCALAHVTKADEAGKCHCGSPRSPIFVEQRRVFWNDEASIMATAVIAESGMTDPVIVTREIWNRTVRKANFPINLDMVEDREFGWFIYDWLGGRELVETVMRRAMERKNAKAGSATPSTAPATSTT